MAIKFDTAQQVTDSIIAMLETGTAPWRKTWSAEDQLHYSNPLRANGKAYRGVNIVTLWATAAAKGYTSPYWFTFKQAQERNACVRKGEKGTHIVFWKQTKYVGKAADGTEEERKGMMLRTYVVFNANQVDGLPAKYFPAPVTEAEALDNCSRAGVLVEAHNVTLKHGGNRAFFSPSLDFVQMPRVKDFESETDYSATLLHELTHWTGHTSRLNRLNMFVKFGDSAYAFEELVAELGAAFLCAALRITNTVREDHAAYVAHWLKVLKDDKKAIFTAASKAQAAVDLLLGALEAEEEDEEIEQCAA